MRDMLGLSYQGLGRHESAERHLRQACEISRRVLGPDDPDTIASKGSLGHLLAEMGRTREAELLLREALEK